MSLIDARRLFQRSLAAAPERLHFAAHSHHLWPDASYVGQLAAWEDAARLADRKWERVMGEVWPAAQRHVAEELALPDPSTVVFGGNTHELIVRLASHLPRPLKLVMGEGEFHSMTRQAARWEEAGEAIVTRVAAGPDLAARVAQAARDAQARLVVLSHVAFGTGAVVEDLAPLADIAGDGGDGPIAVIDGYHGFMAIESDFDPFAERLCYVAGGYKYAMAGEGVGFLHAPHHIAARPVLTGWYAAFDDLQAPSGVGYAPDARRLLGATFDPSGLYRFVAVRDMLADEGLTTARITGHCDALRRAFEAQVGDTPLREAERVNPDIAGAPHARFVALRHPDAARWSERLREREVITDVRGDVLRIGFGLYQSERDLSALIDALHAL